MNMSSARQDFATDQFLRQAKDIQEQDKQAADALREQQEQRQKTESQLGAPVTGKNVSNILMLPAPAKEAETEKDPLRNPVGRVTEDELGKAIGDNTVVNYLNKYRKDNNLPKLKTYSIEDIKDAMTAQNPEGEEGALNAILAYKTNYQNETYTPTDIQNRAVAKNVATGTKGWNDFLTRATGKSDVNTMTQPELHSVITALDALERTGKEEQLVLPEGSNATRFTQDQYTAGVTAALLDTAKDKPVTLDEALKRVQTQKGVDSDQAAERILRTAANNDDLVIEKGTGFQAVSPGGTVLGVYGTEAEAKRNHRRADIVPVETDLVSPRVEESTEKVAQLPEGYAIKTKTVAGETGPAAYVLRQEGSPKNESLIFAEQIDAERYLELRTRNREAQAKAQEAAVDRIRKKLENQQLAIAKMEDEGKTDTADHKNAVAKFKAAEVAEGENIKQLLEKAEALRQPLTIVPFGRKTAKVEKQTVIKGGKDVGTFTGDKGKTARTKAEEFILSQASDAELQTIADRGGVFGKRAELELDSRAKPGIRRATTAGLEAAGVHTPEVEAKLAELKAKLLPMLKKFGLEQVGLNVIREIENNADGAWGKTDKLIRIALKATKPIKTMRHEALHALKELGFFTPQQWEALKRQAEKTWVNKYLKGVAFNDTMSRFDAYTQMGLSNEAILEEAIADAFGDWEGGAKPPPGLMAALFKRLQNFFSALRQALTGAGFESAEDIFGKIERGELKAGKEAAGTEAKMSFSEEVAKAQAYEEKNGIAPYLSVGEQYLPTIDGEKYSLKTKDKYGMYEGIPLNKDGSITVYYHTTKDDAMSINKAKRISPSTKKRVYLTNESSGALVLRNKGLLPQTTDGSVVMLKLPPSLMQFAKKYPDGRVDMFIPLAEGDFFNEKMRVSAIQVSKNKAILEQGQTFSYKDHAARISGALTAYNALSPDGKKQALSRAVDVLREQHNIGTLLTTNGKLEKTSPEAEGLSDLDVNASSMGLGLAAAQKITDKLSSCPNSAICADLCLGDTAGGNQQYGGVAKEDVGDIEKSAFRAGPRMVQYLKTEALVIHPEEFALVLNNEITKFKEFELSTTIKQKNPATGKKELVEAEVYEPSIRLNVTSDFSPEMWKPFFDAHPDVVFYDYTKLQGKPVAKNHHLTYSSTGFAQMIDGELVQHKTNNWNAMRGKLNTGYNVAMAFTSKSALPKTVVDEETGNTYQVWDGDNYDARYLDPKRPDGVGMIVGLRNKAGTMRERESAAQTDGFFANYDPKVDGDKVVVPDQKILTGRKVIPIANQKLSLRIPDAKGFKNWAGKDPIIPASDTSKYKGGSAVFQAFHGTTYSNITVFDPERGSQQGALGAGPYFSTSAKDASSNYAGIGPDLKLRIELLADQLEDDFGFHFEENKERLQEYFDDNNIKVDVNDFDPKAPKFEDNSPDKYFEKAAKYLATKQLKGDSEGLVMPVYIKLEKPFDMTSKNIEFMYDPDTEESVVDDWNRLYEVIDTLATQMQVDPQRAFDAIMDKSDGMTARELRDIIRDNIHMYDDPYTGERSSPNQFMQYVAREMGYDGIIQNASDEYSTMIGVERSRDPDANRTFHIMPFTPQQVKSATGNKGTFDPTNKDIRYSLRTYFPTAEEAENAAYKKAPPSTPEFKRFFGASKAKEEGRPQVMYHASPNEFDMFRENKPIFVSPSAAEAEYYGKRHRNIDKMDVNVYPLWVRAETPFDYENRNHLARLSMYFGDDAVLMGEIADGNWDAIESPEVQDAIIGLGHDSFYVNEGKEKNLAVFKANQVKSVTGNIGEFGENKSIKYSLPVVSAAANARRDETTQQREQKGFIERILDVFSPESMADLRASFIHRYNQLGVYDRLLAEKMGGKVLLADLSAEAAANMSDLSASVTYAAFGIGNRKGGVPRYKNGATIIDTSVKGPLEILSPLAKFNDPEAYRSYQFWAGVKRGSRFMKETSPTGVVSYREKNFQPTDIAIAEEYRKAYMAKGVDFTIIQKEMNTFNDALVDYMVTTGVLSKGKATEFKRHMDYIPFYRQLNGEDTVGPKIFNSISGVKPPKKIKGSEAPLTDYLESIVQNTQAAINAGMKNMAAQRAISVAMQLGPIAGAQKLTAVNGAPDCITVLENGDAVSYRVADQLFVNAVKSLNMVDMPWLGIFSGPANVLRNLVTKDPGFMLANLARDSLSAWVTSGSNMTPIIGTAANFVAALGGKSAIYHALLNAGILGGYEFSSGVMSSAETLQKDLAKKYGTTGKASPLRVFTGIWDALEKGTEASDAATRMAVYERVMAETGNETEALYRALEVMNFNRKGSSPIVRILTAAIPFLNARMQGLDVFYRTAMGTNVSANAKEMQRAFFVRGATLMALSAAYFLAVSDDDEWKKQEQETKDNYWIAPGIGKFPTPFEVGFLFKTVPERIMAYTWKDDTGQDLIDSMQRGLLNTFAFNPIPQTVKPIIEYNANYNFFTGRPIVGQGMEGLEAQYQVGPSTTKISEVMGKALGMSPIKLDQLINSYTGTMGMYAMTAIDAVLDSQSNSPNASKRFEQLPILKRFAADPEARGNITQFYELKKAVDAAVQTENMLIKAGNPEEFIEFMEKNKGLLAIKPYVANIEKSMKQMRETRKMIQGAEMSGDEKQDILTAIGQAENNLSANTQTVKKMLSEF
jgi:hypothetical protein